MDANTRANLKNVIAPAWKSSRMAAGLTIAASAKGLGVTKSLISKLESTKYPHVPSVDMAIDASRLYGVSILSLIGRDSGGKIDLSPLSSNSHGLQAITSPDIKFIGGEPPDKRAICIVQTVGGRALICEWGDGSGLVAWHPLPKLWKVAVKEAC